MITCTLRVNSRRKASQVDDLKGKTAMAPAERTRALMAGAPLGDRGQTFDAFCARLHEGVGAWIGLVLLVKVSARRGVGELADQVLDTMRRVGRGGGVRPTSFLGCLLAREPQVVQRELALLDDMQLDTPAPTQFVLSSALCGNDRVAA